MHIARKGLPQRGLQDPAGRPGATLVDSNRFPGYHGGFAAKSHAVLHSGFRKVLWLDADAYCVADPVPLFSLLDDAAYCYWADWGPGGCCAAVPNPLPSHQNGGEYLVDLEKFWREYQAIHFLDECGRIFYRRNVCADECSTRLVRSLIEDRGVKSLGWVRRTRSVGILCDALGCTRIAHRMRRESKLYEGTVPRGCKDWPLESRVMELFRNRSKGYVELKEQERLARLPATRRAVRQALLKKRRPCTRTA